MIAHEDNRQRLRLLVKGSVLSIDNFRRLDFILRETTMKLLQIAQRLQMGTKTHLSHLLYWQARKQREADARQC
jgi:hypothetical protein